MCARTGSHGQRTFWPRGVEGAERECEYSGPAPRDQEARDKEKALKTELKKLEGREKRNIAVFVEIKRFLSGPRQKMAVRGATRENAHARFSHVTHT